MSLLLIEKISKLVLGPVGYVADTINEWGKEPLKQWEHERNEAAKNNDVIRQTNLQNARIRGGPTCLNN